MDILEEGCLIGADEAIYIENLDLMQRIYVAQYVGKADGFEYAESMVQTARKAAREEGIENVSFYQADACELELECCYDNFMMLRLLTYINKSSTAERIVKNVANALKSGGRLVIKDTLNMEDEEVVYLYNRLSNYQASYWSINIIAGMKRQDWY